MESLLFSEGKEEEWIWGSEGIVGRAWEEEGEETAVGT